jgi:WD40 repeat protein
MVSTLYTQSQKLTAQSRTTAHDESLDEKLLYAVRACKRDDVQALLTQGATLHEVVKATNLSSEMKAIVGESLAVLYSAQCDTPGILAPYSGSFINTSAAIAQLVHSRDVLSLLHTDGSLSEWQSVKEPYSSSLTAPCYQFKLNKTINYVHDSVVSMCGHSGKAYYLTTPNRATCSKAGVITTWSTAGTALDTSASTSIDSIQTVPNQTEYSNEFVMIGTSVQDGVIHLWDLKKKKRRVTIDTGNRTKHRRIAVLCMARCTDDVSRFSDSAMQMGRLY